ncbi:GNAT family N-acetyltransferase [Micromonospora echinofusca]|uniref:GNAT family N-acetyltransferase n=1 Tax=Micromonospora echinofusca TaxID=47858 RepID=A0ABS3VL58_MICEH|nr:GNAT family N-acetyltransferase [Micromonospora echinofusca]MBO4205250.1 GNAT family N-acetyltransferase [Micromonospora echinofusca]
MTVTQTSRVADLDPARWDATVEPGGFYGAVPWLTVAEATADLAPVHLVAEATGVPGPATATLACYPVATTSPFPLCRADVVTGSPDEPMPSLFCGGRHPAHTRINAAGTDPATRARLTDALLARAERLAVDRGMRSVGMLYVDADDAVTRQVLTGRGYRIRCHATAALLAVPDTGLAGYLDGLRSKTRIMVKREISRLADAGLGVTVHPVTAEVQDDLARFETALTDRYGGAFDPQATRRLRETIATHLPGTARVAFADLSGRRCGSLLFFHWRDELYARTAGFDYPVKGDLPVYFGLLFYWLIDHAHSLGVRTIYYSTGADRAKRSRGCRLVGQDAFVKPLR